MKGCYKYITTKKEIKQIIWFLSKKRLTERIPVSHTLNLLRNGKFFKKAI